MGAAAGPKINMIHYKNKTGYRRRLGHRQKYTQVKITGIGEAKATGARRVQQAGDRQAAPRAKSARTQGRHKAKAQRASRRRARQG